MMRSSTLKLVGGALFGFAALVGALGTIALVWLVTRRDDAQVVQIPLLWGTAIISYGDGAKHKALEEKLTEANAEVARLKAALAVANADAKKVESEAASRIEALEVAKQKLSEQLDEQKTAAASATDRIARQSTVTSNQKKSLDRCEADKNVGWDKHAICEKDLAFVKKTLGQLLAQRSEEQGLEKKKGINTPPSQRSDAKLVKCIQVNPSWTGPTVKISGITNGQEQWSITSIVNRRDGNANTCIDRALLPSVREIRLCPEPATWSSCEFFPAKP